MVVRLLLNQLWGHVERGALLCAGFKMQIPKSSDLDGGEDESVESQIPCKPKITKLGPAFTVQQNVLRLDVPEQNQDLIDRSQPILCNSAHL